MGKKIYIFIFLISIIIFSMQKTGLYLPQILNNYANDLLCLPLVLGIITFIIRSLKKDEFFKLPLFFILTMALYYSLYFEYYLPQNNPRYTSDWIDVILYFIGAVAFYSYERKLGFFQIHSKTSD